MNFTPESTPKQLSQDFRDFVTARAGRMTADRPSQMPLPVITPRELEALRKMSVPGRITWRDPGGAGLVAHHWPAKGGAKIRAKTFRKLIDELLILRLPDGTYCVSMLGREALSRQ